MDVGAAQVECPGNVVERGHEHTVGMDLAQGTADAGEFRGDILAGIFDGLRHDGRLGNGRTVGPQTLQQVDVGAQGESAMLAKVLYECLDGTRGTAGAVDGDFS